MNKKQNFRQMLEERWAAGIFSCVGLDSDYSKIPDVVKRAVRDEFARKLASGPQKAAESIFRFNVGIVQATKGSVCAYKPNIAFYESYGPDGITALRKTIGFIKAHAPEVPVILDAKRADIGNTNDEYVEMAFNTLGADAITVHPYLGKEALQPFLEQKDKGIIVLCRTSNSGAGEFQDLEVDGEPLYQIVARRVAEHWNKNGNCAVVVGATYPEELQKVREIVGNMPILIPGIGKQGGDLKKTVEAGGREIIINSSRGVIFASNGPDFAQAARDEVVELNMLINQYRNG